MTDITLKHTESIKNLINQFLPSVVLSQSGFSRQLIESLFPMVTAGKLMRGNIVCDLAEIFQPNISQPLIHRVAAGIELIGSGILIQDDVMDDDQKRRGLPTIHYDWTQKIKNNHWVLPKHHGQSTAICLSDTCLFGGMQMISTAPTRPELCQQMISLSAMEMISLSQVQAIELAVALKETMSDLAEIEDIYIGKTGNYSVAWALVTGAILTDQSIKIQKKLRHIGQQISLAFQIKDDWLGVYGDPKITGKSNTSDIKNKRKTWILLQLAGWQNGQHEKLVNKFITRRDHSLNKNIISLIYQPAFQQFLTEEINQKVKKINLLISRSGLKPELIEYLLSLLTFAVNRKK